MKCEKCGRAFKILEDGNRLPTKSIDEIPKVYCDKCYEQWLLQQKEIQKERTETIEKKIAEERVKKIDNLTQPEAELLAMIHDLNKEQKEFLSKIEHNVQTITNIMIVYFILFLVSLILTIISVVAIL